MQSLNRTNYVHVYDTINMFYTTILKFLDTTFFEISVIFGNYLYILLIRVPTVKPNVYLYGQNEIM